MNNGLTKCRRKVETVKDTEAEEDDLVDEEGRSDLPATPCVPFLQSYASYSHSIIVFLSFVRTCTLLQCRDCFTLINLFTYREAQVIDSVQKKQSVSKSMKPRPKPPVVSGKANADEKQSAVYELSDVEEDTRRSFVEKISNPDDPECRQLMSESLVDTYTEPNAPPILL